MSTRDIAQQPTYLTNEARALNSNEWLAKAQALTRSTGWTKEDSSKFEAFMALHSATRQSSFDREVYNTARQRREAGMRFDAATLAFFSGQKTNREALASPGGTIETRTDTNGRTGSVTELRSYVALNTATSGDAAGYSIPTGFLAEILQQARQYDQLLDASRWIYTPTGNVLNLPGVDDSTTDIDAATLAELGNITQGPNPKFSNLQWPQATTWVTQQFLYSLQLEQDSPVLAMYFAELFGKSFSRGMGKAFLATLLSGLSAGQTTATAGTIIISEIYGLMGSIDTAYAAAPGTGFLMNWSTLLAVRQILTGASGQLAFPHATDADGRPTILGKPVYLCPNMDSIGASKVPIIFGDLQRHAIRAVTDSFSSFRYDERYMVNHQKAIQAYYRSDSLLLKGSSSDAPMKTLVMHS
ncbi:MAG: phage major capsid protein [Candidatus Sulfotelmatobacter sp.]